MSIKAISIIEEFLRSSSEQHRKNAVTALAAIGDKESLARLIRIALTEPDAAIRKRAEQEILSLDGEALEHAIWLLEQATNDLAQRQTANGILGRLNDQGKAVGSPRKSLPIRLRLALSLHRYLYPSRTVGFRLRAWKSGLLGGLIGYVLLAIIAIATGQWKEADIPTYLITGIMMLILSVIAAILITQRTSPISFHRDWLAAIVVESGIASFFCFFGAVIFAFLSHIGSTPTPPFSQFLLMVCLITGMAGIVRAGAITGYGIFSRRRSNKAAQVILGLVFALLTMTLIFFIGWMKATGEEPSGDTFTHFMVWMLNQESARGASWIFLLPLTVTVAYAFATLDNELGPVRRRASRGRKRFFSLLVFASVALLVFAAIILRQERRATLNWGLNQISSVAFSPDGGRLLAGSSYSDTAPLRIWDASRREEITPPPKVAGGYVGSAIFSPDGKLLAASTYSSVRLFDTGNWQEVKSLETSGSMAFTRDSKRLAIGENTDVRIWDTNTWQELSIKLSEPEPIRSVAFFPDGLRLAASSESKTRFWDLNAKRVVGGISHGNYQPVALSPDGKLFATCNENYVSLWDPNAPENPVMKPVMKMEFAVFPLALAFSPDSKLLAVGEGSAVKLVDIGAQKVTTVLKGSLAHVTQIAFSPPPNDKIIAVAYSDGTIKLLDEWKWKRR